MSEKLEDSAVQAGIAGGQWRREDDSIVLDREFADFGEAWGFASSVAEAAEAANHHPDILAHGWNRVRVTLSTHSAGGITDLDLALAAKIDSIGS